MNQWWSPDRSRVSGTCPTVGRTSCDRPPPQQSQKSFPDALSPRFSRSHPRIRSVPESRERCSKEDPPSRRLPVREFNQSGISSSQLSMMKTRRASNLTLLRFFLFSNKQKGAQRGTNINARNSSWHPTLKCFTSSSPDRHHFCLPRPPFPPHLLRNQSPTSPWSSPRTIRLGIQ